MAETKMNLHEKMLEAAKELNYLAKTGHNSNQHYDYVEEAEVKRAVRDALYKRGVLVTFGIQNINSTPSTTAKGTVTFLTQVVANIAFIDAEDPGQRIDVAVPGQGMDQGDKGVYKAMTGAIKYALLNNFMIPSGDDPESFPEPNEEQAEEPAKKGGRKARGWDDVRGIKVEDAGKDDQALSIFATHLQSIDPELDFDKVMKAIGGKVTDKFPGATLEEVYDAIKGIWDQQTINLAEYAQKKLNEKPELKAQIQGRGRRAPLAGDAPSTETE